MPTYVCAPTTHKQKKERRGEGDEYMEVSGSCQAAMGGAAIPLRDSAHSQLLFGHIVIKYPRRETVFSSWKFADETGGVH